MTPTRAGAHQIKAVRQALQHVKRDREEFIATQKLLAWVNRTEARREWVRALLALAALVAWAAFVILLAEVE